LGSDKWNLSNEMMVEEFVPGRELTVSVMGDRALGVTEITTELEFYDYEAKYAPGGSKHILRRKSRKRPPRRRWPWRWLPTRRWAAGSHAHRFPL